MKNRFKKVREKLKMAMMIAGIILMHMNVNVYASGLQSTKLYTGTIRLLNDATTAGIVIIGALATGVEIVLFIKYLTADLNERPQAVKGMKLTLLVTIVAVTIVGSFKAVLSYYS